MAQFQNPVVVVPAITGTDLLDEYPLKTEELWSLVFNKDFERIALHPDDLRYEAREPARIITGRAFPIYNDLVQALRHELSPRADRPTPVFLFPYDWRADLRTTGRRLGTFIEEVLQRTRLLKHYEGADDLEVDLVGHSMGGRVIVECLAQAGSAAGVGKVATLGTPYLGSVEAVVKLATGMSLLAGPKPKEREREAARVTPAVYQLLPWFAGAALDESGQSLDLLEPANMQPSVVESLTEYVRMYSVGVREPERRAKAEELLDELLAGARATRQTMRDFKPRHARMRQSDWLVIAGVGEETRTSLEVLRPGGRIRYHIDDDQFVNDIPSGITGDHTVPLRGAIPPFIPRSQVVCVMKKDLGVFELGDRAMVALGGFHSLLPEVNLVQRLVTRFLRPSYSGDVWGRRVPGSPSWNPPIPGLEEREY